MVRRALVVMSTLLAAMALAVPAMAGFGGGAIITIDHAPDEFVAGETYEVMYTVLWMGETPVGGSSTLEFQALEDEGTSVTGLKFQGTPTGTAGQFIAEVTLPEAGSWTWIALHSKGWSNLGEVEAAPFTLARVLNNDVAALVLAVAATAGLALFVSRTKVKLGPGVFDHLEQVSRERA